MLMFLSSPLACSSFSFMTSELSWTILSQTVLLIWCIPLSEAGDKSRAASRNRRFLKPVNVEVTAAFKSVFWKAALRPCPGFCISSYSFKSGVTKLQFHTPQWLCHSNCFSFFFGGWNLVREQLSNFKCSSMAKFPLSQFLSAWTRRILPNPDFWLWSPGFLSRKL